MWRITLTMLFFFAGIFGIVSAADHATASTLRVAAFRCDVTPPLGHSLIWVTPLKTVEDPLWAKGVVLDDGHNRYVLCAVDWCALCNASHQLFREKLAAAVGTDISRVAVQCLHQHTAPYSDLDAQKLLDTVRNPPRFSDRRSLEDVTDRLAAAVKKAAGETMPFDRIGFGQAKVDRVASSRRVAAAGGKVTVRYSDGGKDPKQRDAPEGDIDPFLKTVTFARGDRPLVRLHYYATHPQTFYGDGRVSSDCVGAAREELEKQESVAEIYFTGCAGDITLGKYNDGSRAARAALTSRLVDGMRASIASTKFAPVDAIIWRTAPLTLPARSDKGYTTEEAHARMADGKLDAASRVSKGALLVAFAKRAKQPLDLCSLKLGPVYLVNLPGEPQCAFQRFAQQLRPSDFVCVAGYGDGGPGYICLDAAFDSGGYEPTGSRVGRTAETPLKAAIGRLLGIDSN